jgi:hypothetical protein
MPEEPAEWQQEEKWQEQNVPAADDEDHSGEHEAPQREAQLAQRSSVYGSRLPDLANPRLSM